MFRILRSGLVAISGKGHPILRKGKKSYNTGLQLEEG